MEDLLRYSTVREALLYEKEADLRVRCKLCERRCSIAPGQKGFCRTRTNIQGKLYTTVFGDVSSLQSRPIEIKPFFHYWPGSTALTYSTWSCNFRCPWCQNHNLSRVEPNPAKAKYLSPEELAAIAFREGDEGLCVSFQEPTLFFESSLSSFREGRRRGLYCCYVSNGYMTTEALEMLEESGMTGLKIDVKGDSETYEKYCGGVDIDFVWRNAREAKRMGIHVEIVNLVVTGVNDNDSCLESVISRHLEEVGAETPLHFTRYYPAYQFRNPPTKVETLERAYTMAKRAGVAYPYIGNVRGHRYENTYCPNCAEPLVRRLGYAVVRYNLTDMNECPKCRASIPMTGRYVRKLPPLF